jgi:hypothetical protein
MKALKNVTEVSVDGVWWCAGDRDKDEVDTGWPRPEAMRESSLLRFLEQLSAAVTTGMVTITERSLPPSKREYRRLGRPELPPIRSLSVVSAA